MLILSHPTGNEFVRYALRGLLDENYLHQYYTSIACFEGDLLFNLGQFKQLSELRKRVYDISLKGKIKTSSYDEWMRQLAIKIGAKSLFKHEFGRFSVDAVYRKHDLFVAKNIRFNRNRNINGVIAYEDAAQSTFQVAKELNLTRYYDLSIGYWKYAKTILELEKERNPAYASTLTGLFNSDEKLAKKDSELALSDHIIVASQFTKETLSAYNGKLSPISVIPYGFPPVSDNYNIKSDLPIVPLKLLFVGGLTQRKGIAEVFEAVKGFKQHIELTVIGRKTGFDCPILDRELLKHRYIPSLNHKLILEEMANHHVLIFPSLFEGFGMVISEAMSQGTPVITTKRTAAADFIEHKKNGWLVEPNNVDQIKTIISELLISPNLINEIGVAAQNTARNRPWSMYSKEMAAFTINNI